MTVIAFDTNCIQIVARDPSHPETPVLKRIFELKTNGNMDWRLCYLDIVQRETVGSRYERTSYEQDLQDVLRHFDQKISLSRLPMIVPVIIPSAEDNERDSRFNELGKSDHVSKRCTGTL